MAPHTSQTGASPCICAFNRSRDAVTATALTARLRERRREAGRETARVEVSLGGRLREPDDVKRWEDAGVDRLVVSPWQRSRECIEGLRRYAEMAFG